MIEEFANTNPRVYWSQQGRRKYSKLYKLAERLFLLPVGSIATERVWSAFSFVYNKLRNRTASEVLMKLVFIYVNSKLLDQEDSADYSESCDFFGFED